MVAEATGHERRNVDRSWPGTIHEGKRVSFWWTMGVNQSHEGVRTAQAIINLALMTGNIGRPGTGANSITGQCNAMGSRLFSNTTNLLGGRDFANPEHRAKVGRMLGIDADRIPDRKPGLRPDHRGDLQRQDQGPVGHRHQPRALLDQPAGILDALDAARLPGRAGHVHDHRDRPARRPGAAAAGWGEKEGTFINSERRFGLVKKVARAPGQALADFDIFQLDRRSLGLGDDVRRWSTPEAVFQILKELSRDQPCDITGIADYAGSTTAGGIQWPCTDKTQTGGAGASEVKSEKRRDTPRLFADGRFFHPDGRARIVFEDPRPLPEAPDARFPLLLLTGRGSAAQWHTGTRTEKSAVLRKLRPAGVYVEINPLDAERLGIAPGVSVSVSSRRGSVPGHCFCHLHDFPRPGVYPHALCSCQSANFSKLRSLFRATSL